MTQLELVLLLHRDPAATWTAERVAAEMRYPSTWSADQLGRFARAGLFDEAEGEGFRYRASNDRAGVVDELAELYRRRRTSLTSLIFTRAAEEVQLLSDAFRIRRERDE